jgi:DNA-binding MarR family transcriptional regulator
MQTDPRTEIGELWRQVHHQLHERFRSAFRGSEMPPMFPILLRVIARTPGLTVSELARQSGTAKSHVSKMIDQMVQQGYVEKHSDPADQRLLRVCLTQTAAETMAEVEARMHVAWTEVMDAVPEGEVEILARSLRILLTAVQQANADAPVGNIWSPRDQANGDENV